MKVNLDYLVEELNQETGYPKYQIKDILKSLFNDSTPIFIH